MNLSVALTRDVRLNSDLSSQSGVKRDCVCPNSRYRGLYRNFLRDGFPVGWFELVGFKVLVGRTPLLHNQILDFQNFVENSHIRSTPLTTQIFSYAVYWCSIITRWALWFSTIIYWQVRIFTYLPRFLKRGQGKFRGTFQKYYLFRPFFVCRRFLFY